MKQSLPGITRIGWLPLYQISPDVRLKALAGIPVAVLADINYVELVGNAVCECETSLLNGGFIESLSLKFAAQGELPLLREIAWVISTASGQNYLIGSRERPYAVWAATLSTGSPDGDRAVYSVKVTLKSIKSLIKVVL